MLILNQLTFFGAGVCCGMAVVMVLASRMMRRPFPAAPVFAELVSAAVLLLLGFTGWPQ